LSPRAILPRVPVSIFSYPFSFQPVLSTEYKLHPMIIIGLIFAYVIIYLSLTTSAAETKKGQATLGKVPVPLSADEKLMAPSHFIGAGVPSSAARTLLIRSPVSGWVER
jgi:hypothetical protein